MNQSFRPVPNRLMRALKRMAASLCFLLAWVATSQAQVSTSYTFTGSSGTYTEITGGTQLWGGTLQLDNFDNSVSSAQTIPSFNFNGTAYTEMYVSTNGFITFGSAPTSTNFTPISGNESYAGAISGFGADLENRSGLNAREIRWETIGNEVIIQWKGVRRQNLSENFNFQIRLNTATNTIVIIYGPRSTPDNATTFQPEVGLRGPSNLLLSNLNSRRVESGAETWANSLAGTSFSHKVRFTNMQGDFRGVLVFQA